MIFVVIPVFNRWHFTEACLRSLDCQSYRDFKVVVVDHGSADGTREKLKQYFPDVIVLYGDESMWWTAATNLGVEYALSSGAEYILTLNNDLTVPADYLKNLMATAQSCPKSILGSLTVDKHHPSKVVFCGVNWNNHTARYRPSLSMQMSYQEISILGTVGTDVLPGRGTLIPSTAFAEVGLFDQKNFPHYQADEDFSRRCVENGYKLIVATNAVVYSETSATGYHSPSGNLFKHLFRTFTSIKSPNKLSVRWRWAKRHGSIPVFYFVCDMSRILFGQLKKSFV